MSVRVNVSDSIFVTPNTESGSRRVLQLANQYHTHLDLLFDRHHIFSYMDGLKAKRTNPQGIRMTMTNGGARVQHSL
ncbi:hypothetical protein VNO77_01175 [Canavalia gladiata]|uniref:Uncharacterized protein n=1 Tax=Canavalia gladiata TaxID=3824 RepID=A0AAN9RA04_CANGL